MKGKRITCLLIIAEVIYLSGFFIWITGAIPDIEEILTRIYTTFNPFTIGAYLSGITALLSLIFLKNIWIKLFLSITYVLTLTISGIALMGIFKFGDLVMYVPHMAILLACSYVVYCKCKGKMIFVNRGTNYEK